MIVENNKIPQIVLNVFFIILVTLTIAPFLLLVSSSLTSEAELVANGYNFIPREFSVESYKYLVKNISVISRGYIVTIFVTIVGTTTGVLITVLFAYPLSRKELPFRRFFAFFVFFTMLFNGGLVPSYMMWTNAFKIRNTIYALIFPGLLMSGFNIILMRSFFTANIPNALIEAARIDGCSEFGILRKVVLPLSKPMLATLSLMMGLGYWNDWTNSLYYITDQNLFSIQAILNTILNNVQFLSSGQNTYSSGVAETLPSVSARMAIAVIGIVPILIVYPFFQKYFVQGIVVGGVKG